MNPAKRRTVIAGNWKMNFTPAEATAFINEIKPMVAGKDNCDIVFCAPYVTIDAAQKAAAGSNIKIGAENVHFKASGAYTGEISAEMLCEAGVEYVVIGHSERRQYFGETDATVNARTKAALAAGLKPIICVGETLEQREKNRTKSVVRKQINGAFDGIDADELKNIVVAYEPVWAIGTGKTATSEQAEETIKNIRSMVAKLYGRKLANKLRIQYGGSMNPKNVSELMAQPNIDGGLIGGASLKAVDFSQVVNY